jgi:antitoxin component of RelBE/YafQ-DinJ toxin-antitoxin module
MTKKRVNIVLDEDVHRDAVTLAKSFGYDFSSFVNLMLETVISPEEIEGQQELLAEMIVKEIRGRGFNVTKESLKPRAEKWNREQGEKRKKQPVR